MKNELLITLCWAGAMIAVALAASFARAQGYIDQETVLRVVAMNGLMIAFYGNRMPKAIAPSACAQHVLRVGGWSMVLSGLVYAALFAFAPIAVAVTFGVGAVAIGMAVTLGCCLWLRARTKVA
ncbi:hypothetical protein FHS96_004019 [Sphingomonas zeicaulis]|uniref:ammonium transporter n=1 Tax=Sphingomonas zeicaulis TaxID=1632740 RepID=UPI003D2373CD